MLSRSSSISSKTAATNVGGDTSRDIALASPPADGISSLAFSSAIDWLAVSSWDATVKVYDVTQSAAGQQGRAQIQFDGPVLSCHWSPDGQKVVGAGADKTARVLDLAGNGGANSAQQVAAHDQPIRSVRFFQMANSNQPMLVTGSWDKTIRYWDLRQSTPAASISLPERVYSMDVKQGLLAVATADNTYSIVDLTNPTKIFVTRQSPLKMQCRVISCYHDGSGVALGSVEGRCAFQVVDEKNRDSNFTFKCHRDTAPVGRPNDPVNVYAVNDISFHPGYGTFSTAGADGTFHFWDKDQRARLKAFPKADGIISATAFNRSGSMFAYAVSYDWSMGHSANNAQYPIKIMVHPVEDSEVQPRAAKKR